MPASVHPGSSSLTEGKGDESDCPHGTLPCDRDCCHRGLQFCNTKQKRCQHCSTREMYCGNSSLLPPACDVYCFKLDTSSICSGMPGGVHSAYFWSTCVLAAVIALMLVWKGGHCCRKKWRKQHRHQINEARRDTAAQPDSPLGSLLSGDNASESRPADNARNTSARSDDHAGLQLSPFGQPDSASLTLTWEPLLTPPSTPPISRPLTQSVQPPTQTTETQCFAHRRLRDEEDTKVKVAVSVPTGSAAISSVPLCKANHLCSGDLSNHSALHTELGQRIAQPLNCGNNNDHNSFSDPRLKNISPAADSDNFVSVHTGHVGPLNGGIRYVIEN